MYDLTNKEDKDYIDTLALFDEPIPFYNLKIYSPLIKNVIRVGDNNYRKALSTINSDASFYFGKDCNVDLLTFLIMTQKEERDRILLEYEKYCLENYEKLNEKFINNYSLFQATKNLNSYINGYDSIKVILSLIFRCKLSDIDYNVIPDEGMSLIIKPNLVTINKERFEELRNIICEITNTNKITYKDREEKKETKDEDIEYKSVDPAFAERVKEYFRNRKAMKKKVRKKDEEKQDKIFKMLNVLRYVANVRGYDIVKNYNIYQLTDAYKYINCDVRFKFDLAVGSSGYAGEDFKITDIKEMISE